MLNERSMAVHVPAFTCGLTVYLVACSGIHLPGSVAHLILSMEIHASQKVAPIPTLRFEVRRGSLKEDGENEELRQ